MQKLPDDAGEGAVPEPESEPGEPVEEREVAV